VVEEVIIKKRGGESYKRIEKLKTKNKKMKWII